MFWYPGLISFQIFAFNGDNATSNDKQTMHLAQMENSFDDVNRVRCFNHTMQLSARALLKPFNTPAREDDDGASSGDQVDNVEDDIDDVFTDEDSDEEDEDAVEDAEIDDYEEEEDPFEALDDESKDQLLGNTAAVRTTLSKVRVDDFFIEILLILWSRFGNCLLRLYTLRLLLYLPGGRSVSSMRYVLVLFHVIFLHVGTRHLICSRWLLSIAALLMTLRPTNQ